MTIDSPVADGRVLRGARTRGRIVQALLDLLNDGVANPTAATIAERADVSVRSVFQHFDDLESLYADLAAEQSSRVEPLLQSLETPAALHDRIVALVAHRAELFETISPVRHAIGSRAEASPALAARIAELGAALRAQLEHQFGAELDAPSGDARARLVDALDVLCSFEAWDRMRVHQGLDARAASATLTEALHRLLR
jgi:AcrR family transcriptional regulator